MVNTGDSRYIIAGRVSHAGHRGGKQENLSLGNGKACTKKVGGISMSGLTVYTVQYGSNEFILEITLKQG